MLGITDDYSQQECLVLTPTRTSLKQKYFSDIPYPRYISGEMFIWLQDGCLMMITSQNTEQVHTVSQKHIVYK